MQVKKTKSSFSLIEIIVVTVIIGIGSVFLAGLLVTGKVLLKQAQNKAAAMSLATLQLDRFTAYSYEGLNSGLLPPTTGTYRTSHGKTLNWNVTITARDMGSVTIVPYQEIVVEVDYEEDTLRPATVEKRVSLTSFVPYPNKHIEMFEVDSAVPGNPVRYSIMTPSGCVPPDPNCVFPDFECVNDDGCALRPSGALPGSGPWALAIPLWYGTDKTATVAYNIALDIVDGSELNPADTIFTRVYLEDLDDASTGRVWFPAIADTPIISQVSISGRNVLPLSRSTNYTIGVEWRKDTEFGIIRVRRANLIIEATEPPN